MIIGRYASYGIIDSFRISLKSLNEGIKRNLWGKSLDDFELDSILPQFPIRIYDVLQKDDHLLFRLKDSVTSKDIVGIMRDFFNIFPYEFKGIDALLDKLQTMTMEELRSFARLRMEENFQQFSLSGVWYGMKVEIDNRIFYPDTDVVGFLICMSYDKMSVEDDIAPFNFLTELLRYRLRENPLGDTLLSFLSQ